MKKKKQDILKKSIIRSLLLLLATISLIIGLLITVEALTSNKEKKEALLNYEKRGKIDYVVNLKENDLYNDSSIEEENVISKYIESIKANFKYEFSSSKNLDSDATYILKLTLVNSYNSNAQKETLLEKEYELMPESNIKSNNKGVIFFEKEIEINYDEYNQIAKKIREESGILTEAYLELELSIKNNLTDNDLVNIDDENSLKLNIPLLENITSITKEGEFNTKDTLYNITKGNMNYATLTAGLCLIAVSICFTITSLKMFVELNNITIYTMEQNKILKRYGDVIAETKAKPDLKDLEVIDITNFIDLINIEDELRIPILFFETHKGKESWFIIIHNDKAYRYTLQLETNKK